MNKNFTKQDIEQFFYDTVYKNSLVQVKELKKLDENIYSTVVSGTYNYNVILNLNNLRKQLLVYSNW